MPYSSLTIDTAGPIAQLRLNRPDKANAMNLAFWQELPLALAEIDAAEQVRVLILSGNGRHFSAGIDVEALAHLGGMVLGKGCPARAREQLHRFIRDAQAAFSRCEQLRVPVIAAVHGACIGAGIDLIAACDIRLGSLDARYSIKEVDLAVVPDVGTLHRLRHVIGLSAVAELSYTAESFDAARALQLGLVSRNFDDPAALMAGAEAMAATIAAKSPITVRGIKHNLLHARDHSVAEGLAYTAAWNAAMLVSADAQEAMAAQLQKRTPKFAD